MSIEPVPQRLSDADRDAAVEMLRQHFAEGRLDQSEFDERMGSALVARYAGDLGPLFVDLPAPRPEAAGPLPAPPPLPALAPLAVVQPAPDTRSLAMVQALLWPMAIALMLFTDFGIGWIFVAIVVSIILKQLNRNRRTPPPPLGP